MRLSEPTLKPEDLLRQMDRNAVAREFTAAADTQFGELRVPSAPPASWRSS
jgi:hypothetical protein